MNTASVSSFDLFLNWLAHGYLNWSWWQILVFTLIVTHITIAGVTIFLHRCQAHRALDLHPIASHFFRFWLWLTTGMVTKEWAAIHRKHHAKVETPEDPHSPQVKGIWKVLFEGAELYRKESKNQERAKLTKKAAFCGGMLARGEAVGSKRFVRACSAERSCCWRSL